MATDVLFPDVSGAVMPRKIGKLLRHAKSINIAEDLTDEDLGEIGSRALRGYKIDKASRADWEKGVQSAMDLAMQVAEEKQYPWPKAANVKFPLLTTAALQFNARAYPAILNGRNIVKGQVNGEDDGTKRARADRVARHMSYQLTEEMLEWDEDTDKLLVILPIVGMAFRKTWFDPTLGRNRSELVTAQKLVVNNGAKSLETASRLTHEIDPLYPHEIVERVNSGVYRDVELGIPQDSGGDDDAPHEFLEQHCRLDLDDDGYPEPYVVTIHKETSQVVRIVARYDEEGIQVDGRGGLTRIEPIHYFTKYSFIPAPDGGFHDIGFGWLLNPINETVNATLNQMLDAGHLQNTGGGFIGTGLRIKGGSARFRPGEYKQVEATGGKVRENIVTLPFPGPSPVLFQLLGLLIEAARDITSVKDVLTGDAGPSNEAATRTLARIEQGLKVFTAIYKRIFRSLKSEYKKLFRLNQIYLEPDTYFTLLDEPEAIGPQDYDSKSMDIVPVADPSMVSDMQKLAKAEFLMGFMGDPDLDGMEIKKRVFEAVGVDDIPALFRKGEPPPDPRLMEAADKIEIEKKKLELEYARTQGQLAKWEAEGVLDIAKAEAEEAGTQIEAYRGLMQQINERAKIAVQDAANQGRVRGMEGQSGNAGGPGAPGGQASGDPGGVAAGPALDGGGPLGGPAL